MSERKVPKIRFPGFTDDWEQRKLGDMCSSFEYGLNASAKEFDGKNKYIRITDIDDDSREFNQDNITSPETDLSNAEKYKLSEGDILFARTGASVGKTYIYKASDGLVYYAGFLIRARINRDCNPEFVFQNTLTLDYEKFIKTTSMRSGQPGVNAQEYSQFEIRVPSKLEQDRIADYFRNLDNLIALHQRELDKWKELKKGMLQKMFPKDGESVPEIRFPGFEGQWKRYKLEEVTDEFRSGTFIAATDIVDDGEYPVYGGNGLRGYANTFNHDGEFALIGRQGALCGNVNYSYGKAYFTEHAVAVKANSSANTKFLFYLLDLMKLGQYSDQSAQPGLAVGKLIKLENMFPSKQEQERISNLFSLLDMIISNLQGEVMKWQSLKKALLQQMFV